MVCRLFEPLPVEIHEQLEKGLWQDTATQAWRRCECLIKELPTVAIDIQQILAQIAGLPSL